MCAQGDPSDGQLLRIFLTYLEGADLDQDCQQYFISVAIASSKLTSAQLRYILTHPKVVDPFKSNPEATHYYSPDECAIEKSIRHKNAEYFKELLLLCKDPQLDQCLAWACQRSCLAIVKYLIEERGMSVNEIICGKTPLQHALQCSSHRKKPVVDYFLTRGADVNAKDVNSNTVLLYACANGYNNPSKLISPETDLRVKSSNMTMYGTDSLPDGVTAFGLAATHDPIFVKSLFELKSTMKFDPEFEREVITEVLIYGQYAAITTMWSFVNTRDIVDVLLTERMYTIKDHEEMLKPIEKFFQDFTDLQEQIDLSHATWSSMESESELRALWRHALKNLSREEVEMLLRAKTKSGDPLIRTVEGHTLLPEEYRVSNQLWSSNIGFNLGSLSDLPREIIKLIFNYVTFSEACQTVSVSKSWFKEITAKTFWIAHPKADSSSSNPFRSIQKFIANSYIKGRHHDCFHQMVRVDDGEGLLIMEEGFLTGIKLNGEPIISSWPQSCGSVFRCMARSRTLTQDCIESSVKQIEHLLNSGRIEFDTLVDTLMPFLKCLASGIYDISVQISGDYKLFEFSSDSNLSEVHSEFPFRSLVYFTQPSDLLNSERIQFYEKQIQSGIRPAVLALRAYEELFIIDGHHKISAYKNLGLLSELVVVGVGRNDLDRGKIPVEEEMKYLNHAREVVNRYNQAKKSMYFNEDD